MIVVRAKTRRLSDWIGFLFYGVLASATLGQMPSVGVLLAPTLALELFAAVSFLIREPARASERSHRALISAYGGTLFVFAFVLMARHFQPTWMAATSSEALRSAGILLWSVGSVWAAYSVWYLRFAFSIEPEARSLVTSGPYRFARHPVYTGYFAQYAGIWLLFPTIPFALALVFWLALMADRMRNEERVLHRTLSDYAAYRRSVGALGPTSLRGLLRALPG